jgi:hypothetical protein
MRWSRYKISSNRDKGQQPVLVLGPFLREVWVPLWLLIMINTISNYKHSHDSTGAIPISLINSISTTTTSNIICNNMVPRGKIASARVRPSSGINSNTKHTIQETICPWGAIIRENQLARVTIRRLSTMPIES